MSTLHHHLKSLSRPSATEKGDLPSNKFGCLVGTIDHVSLSAKNRPQPKDPGADANEHHVFLWFNVNAGPYAGSYECAFNVQSELADGDKAEVQFATHDEVVTTGDLPTVGFFDAKVSYHALGLKQSDFRPMINGVVRSIVIHNAETCDFAAAYGTTYAEGTGIHDIHQHGGKNAENDGALAFYFRKVGEAPIRRWIFIKFANQSL